MNSYEKRLPKILKAKSDSRLTDTELQWAIISARDAVKRGAGTPPRYLDIKSISTTTDPALEPESLSECLNPGYIGMRCTHGNTTAKITRCRWCDGCQNAWRGRVRGMVMDGARFHDPTFFWTLTLAEYPDEMPINRFDFISGKWKELIRWKAKWKIGFEYFRVIELQKRGTPHYHVAANRWTYQGVAVSGLLQVRVLASQLRAKSGFGVQSDVQVAYLGAKGAASYMAKYLQKGGDYETMVREDGRAVRRYARSRGWIPPLPEPSWRYAAVRGSYSRKTKSTVDVPCSCGNHEDLNRGEQISRWLEANRKAGSWIAPLAILDWILEEENEAS